MNGLHRTIRIALMLSSLFAGSQAFAADGERDVAVEINKANGLLRSGDVDAAVKAYREVQNGAPDRADLSYNMAVAQYRKGDVAAAEKLFNQASAAEDDALAAKARYNLGNCNYAAALRSAESDHAAAIKGLEKAIENYRSALEIDSNDADSRANIELASAMIDKLREQDKKQRQHQEQSKDKHEQNKENSKQQEKQDNKDSQQQQGKDQQQSQQNEQQKPDSSQAKKSQGQQGSQDQQYKNKNEDAKSQSENNSKSQSQKQKSQSQESKSEKDSQPQAQSKANPSDQKEQSKSQNQSQASSKQRPKDQRPEQGESKQSEQAKDQQGSAAPKGALSAADQKAGKADPQGKEAASQPEVVPEGAMTVQEAEKMLQAIRDQEMIRRLKRQAAERNQHVPVDRDW